MASAAEYKDGYWWSNDGLRLHYRDYAFGDNQSDDKPPIICLPGLTRNGRDFAPVADAFAHDWRVIAVDFRGRGDSAYAKDPMTYVPLTYVQDLEALLAELNLDHYIAFGTSLGGIVTMLSAATIQRKMTGAIINDIGPDIDPRGLERIKNYVGQGRSYETWAHAARGLSEGGEMMFPDYTLNDWIGFAKKCCKLSSSGRIVLDYDSRIAEPFKVQGGEAGVDLWPAFKGLSDIPTLLLRGEISDILSAQTAEKMVKQLRKATLCTVKNVGHCPALDEKDSVAAIEQFLSGLKSNHS